MANLQPKAVVFAGGTDQIDTTLQHPLGTKASDVNGNEYIYMTGVASTVAGSWVTFDEVHSTTLSAEDAVGRVAVAMAAIDSTSQYGWYQIYGNNTISQSVATSDNTPLYADALAGKVDDDASAGNLIIGAVARSDSASGVLTVELNYPFLTDSLGS